MLTWHDPGKLIDHELQLVLHQRYPGDEKKNYAPSYRFNIKYIGQNEEAGNIELRIGDSEYIKLYAGHIGYRVHPPYRGHRFASRACRLLIPLARKHGLNPIWITCNPDNYASRRSCELAGAVLVEIVDLPPDIDMYQDGERQKCRYRLDI
ncbi:MAG TPA: GNAT family N-acetyltransferase [Anaerolineae bacterium]|jgi:tagatose 1,6-diphosphate aldolase